MKNYFQRANDLRLKGKLEEAISFYEKAIDQNPEFYLYYYSLGETLAQLGRWDNAVIYYCKSLELNPNYCFSYYHQGEALVKLNNWDEALISYHRAVELNPNHYWFCKKLGDVLFQLAINVNQEFIESLQKQNQLLENLLEPTEKSACTQELLIKDEIFIEKTKNFDDTKFIDELYRCYLLRETDKNGKNTYLQQLNNGIERQNLIQIFRDSQEFKHKLAISFRSTKLWKIIDDNFLQLTANLNNQIFIEEVYRSYLKREPDEDGKTHHLQHIAKGFSRHQVLTEVRESPEFTSKLILSIKLSCLQASVLAYRRGLDLNPRSKQCIQHLANSLNHLGKIWEQQGKLGEAQEIYQQAIAVASHLGEAFYNLGNVHLQIGELDEAIENYQQAISTNPKWQEPYISLGNVLRIRGNAKEAIEAWERAIALNPKNLHLHNNLGMILWQNNKVEEAIPYLEQAVALEPTWEYPYFLLGNCLLQKGEYEDALKFHKKALSLQPNWHPFGYFSLGLVVPRFDDSLPLERILLVYEQAFSLRPDWIEGYYEAGNWLFHCGYKELAMEFWRKSIKSQSDLAKKNQIDSQGYRFFGWDYLRNIGHIALLDFFVKMDILGWLSLKNKAFIWKTSNTQVAANSCLLNYWSPYIPIICEVSEHPDLFPLVKYAEQWVQIVTLDNGQSINYFDAITAVQKQWESENRSPLLNLSDSDLERGKKCLQSLGIPCDAWFVCLHVKQLGEDQKYLVDFVRDSDIDTYNLAIKSIVDRGGWVIRIGDPKMKKLPLMERVVDYAHSELKSDWMDVFLLSQCRFFIGTNSGPFLVPPIFGVACVFTNWIPLSTSPMFGNSIFISKSLWYEKENRYLSFEEAISIPLGCGEYRKYYYSKGISVIDNTPEEINDIVMEMLDRLDNNLVYTEEDESLQNLLKNLIEKHGSYLGSRMGQKFLRSHATKGKKLGEEILM